MPQSCCWLSSEDIPLFFKVAVGNTCMDRESGLSVTSAVVQLRINISTLEASTKTTVARALPLYCRTLYCLFVFFLNITQHAINLLIWRPAPPDRLSLPPGSQSNLCMHACAPSVFCSFSSGKCTMCRRSTSSSVCRLALPQGSSFFKRREEKCKKFFRNVFCGRLYWSLYTQVRFTASSENGEIQRNVSSD